MKNTNSAPKKIQHAGKNIGLITPYQGFNYGDGAIQETVIQGLIKRDPSSTCFGITLYPADTEKRHGIKSIPITGLIVSRYSDPELLFADDAIPQRSLDDNEQVEANGHEENLKLSTQQKIVEFLRGVKNLPLLGNIFRFIVFRLRDLNKLGIEAREFLRAIRFARKLDLLLLSGGGQLDESAGGSWGHPYNIFRWALIGKMTGTPFAVASCGSAEIKTTLTRWFLQKALKSAVYRSYRDIGTRNQLVQHWKFTENDPIVRDLALGLDPSPFFKTEDKDSDQLIVGISPIYHSDPQYTTYDAFVEGMVDFIHWLVNRGDHVLLFRTTSVERLVIRDIWNSLRSRYGDIFSKQVSEVEAGNYQELMEKIAVVDLVVASRLHSIILSHVLNKPTLAISWDRKVSAHMQDLEQEKYMIDINSLNGEILKEVFQLLEADAVQIRSTIKNRIDSFQSDINQQYEHLLSIE